MKIYRIIALAAAAFALTACDIDKTEDGEMPSVDVDVESGELPSYDVETADIEVGEKEVTMEVPDVDVDMSMEEKSMTVPDVDINMPDEKTEIEQK